MSERTACLVLGVATLVVFGFMMLRGEGGEKMFSFKDFHGSSDLSTTFSFRYPANWKNDGQYFSPQEIEYYTLYSVKAPVYFDLIRADIFPDTEFNYQIRASKRRSPDTLVTISGQQFTRYDLEDYGSYGGESAGRVIIYVGPQLKVKDQSYYLVFRWEEKPLTAEIPGNDPAVFEKIVESLEFKR